MKLFTIATILALAASSAAGQIKHGLSQDYGSYGYAQGHHSSHDYYAYPKYTYNYGVADKLAYPAYKFSYGVNDKITGDQKSQVEARDGGVVKGSYSLVQPDGVLRTVNYIATPHGGFQAQVINKGVAGHPAVYGLHHG